MILDETQAIDYIKANQSLSPRIQKSREVANEMFALVEGDGFAEELINKIEHLEAPEKARARLKYSRNITDFFERLFQPISNIYNSSGGSKQYKIEKDNTRSELISLLSKVNGNKSLSKWLQDYWMKLYHTDPNGVIMLEYETKDGLKIWPVYKSSGVIRNYIPSGQNVEVILFEPYDIKISGESIKAWRIIDDKMDRTFFQKGTSFSLATETHLTFEHPFGKVPCIINSDIEKLGYKYRVTPIDKIVALTKEYARDQSIKTVYKFLQGFPIHWRYVVTCKTCEGRGKISSKICTDCDGKGILQRQDVTDQVTLPAPEDKEDPVIAPNIAGYINPSIEVWDKYDEELKLLENYAHATHWGMTMEKTDGTTNETATGRFIDVQPKINKLNQYADTAEWVEWQMSDWLSKALIPSISKNETKVSINYGRQFIFDSADAMLKSYHDSKAAGDNSTVLDRKMNEYLLSKFRNDPVSLRENLLKLEVEPYAHYTVEQIQNVFGKREAAKKVHFNDWWASLDESDFDKAPDVLTNQFQTWISNLKIEIDDGNGGM